MKRNAWPHSLWSCIWKKKKKKKRARRFGNIMKPSIIIKGDPDSRFFFFFLFVLKNLSFITKHVLLHYYEKENINCKKKIQMNFFFRNWWTKYLGYNNTRERERESLKQFQPIPIRTCSCVILPIKEKEKIAELKRKKKKKRTERSVRLFNIPSATYWFFSFLSVYSLVGGGKDFQRTKKTIVAGILYTMSLQ